MKCADTNVMERASPAIESSTQPTEGILSFPGGLLGFEDVKQYLLLGSPEEAPFLWLQMAGSRKLAFLVISPAMILDSYHPEISAEDVEFLNLENSQDAMVFNIVTLHKDGSATVNLKGPIVVNRRTLLGKQVIPLNAADYALHRPLPVAKP